MLVISTSASHFLALDCPGTITDNTINTAPVNIDSWMLCGGSTKSQSYR